MGLNEKPPSKGVLGPPGWAGIFLCSLSAISFEITLTRIFSISLWYHYAFMVVSIAMLGIGLSGTMQAIFPNLKLGRRLGPYALLLGVSIPLGFLLTNMVPFDPARLSWDYRQLLYICLYYLILSVPFLFFGLIISTAFVLESQRSTLVYASDLLGAGMGSVLALLLIGWAGLGGAVILIALGPVLAAFLFGRRRASIALALLLLAGFGIFPEAFSVRISQYKELPQALLFPGARHIRTYQSGFQRVDIFNSPMARFAPGLSLSYMEELPEQSGVTVDGTSMSAITDARGKTPEFVRRLPSAFPYAIKKVGRAMLVEPGGGLPVLIARSFNVSEIHVADSNPLLLEVIREDLGRYSGGIYKDNAHGRMARSALRSIGGSFDLIDISMLGALPAGSFGIWEDYRFTLEAFSEYFGRLNEDGLLSLSMYVLPPERVELRVLSTAMEALEGLGVEYDGPSSRNILVLRSWGVITILIKRSPFEPPEIARARGFADENGFDMAYWHGMPEGEQGKYIKGISQDPYRAFRLLADSTTRKGFIESYPFDVSASKDDRPFFHYYIKSGRLGEIYELTGRKWQFFIEQGYMLPVVFVQAVLLSILLLVMPLLKSGMRAVRSKSALIYFALLGLGFMFIEIPLMQRMILPFETPSLAVAVVLASVLVSCGIGSLLSSRFGLLRRPHILLPAIAALSLPYMLWLSEAASFMSLMPLPLRAIICFVMIFPLGALMGIPFPLGISLLGRHEPGLLPWAWAVNGCFSVIAPLLAVQLAISLGYTGVIMLGACMYMLALPVMLKTMRLKRGG